MKVDPLPRVLCVDDEPNLLAALERTLDEFYSVTTAPSAPAALTLLQSAEPFDVVISDMRMPEMDGSIFLTRVREQWPDTVRVLLTGYADTQSAIAAVNGGAIFRYLCKPCPAETLLATLKEAVEHHRVQQAERHLLETTLSATVKILADILSLSSPWAFRRSSLARSCVCHALEKLKWPQGWIYDVAAAVSQIGSIGIPDEVLRREAAQWPLTAADAQLMHEHPETAYRLLKSIPRLETVAEIVRYQGKSAPVGASLEVLRGSQLLRAALMVGQYLLRGQSVKKGLEAVRALPSVIAEPILAALADFQEGPGDIRAANFSELVPGWILGENVSTIKGQLLLSKGQELTEAAILSLRRLKSARLIVEPVYVRTRSAATVA